VCNARPCQERRARAAAQAAQVRTAVAKTPSVKTVVKQPVTQTKTQSRGVPKRRS